MPRYSAGIVLAALLLVLPGVAAGVTSYDIALDGDQAALNATIELYPENPDRTTRYSTTWQLPDGATVQSVEDSDGPLEYEHVGDGVSFTSVISAGEEKEVVTITAEIDDAVTEEYREVDLIRFQLSGFRDTKPDVPEEVTQVRLTSDRRLLAGSHSFGFDSAMDTHSANYSGAGPVNVQLGVSDQGEEYENLVLFGPGNLSTADDLYWVPVAVTGFHPQVNKYPVIVYEDDRYDEVVDAWSAGQYRTGGLIFVRESTMEEDKGPAVVLHEVMHGFNDEALNWFAGDRAWFDEGTAKYVEWAVNANREVPQAEIFGEEVSWRCGPRTRCSYDPRGTPDQLWDFYQRNESFLAEWSPLNSPDTETRRFGYALSELVVRDYVHRHGADGLQPVYDELLALNEDMDEELSGRDATRELQRVMDTDLRPCKADERDVFDRCLDDVNEMDAALPDPGSATRDVQKVEIQPIEEPKQPDQTTTDQIGQTVEPVREEAVNDAQRLLYELQRFVQWLVNLVGNR